MVGFVVNLQQLPTCVEGFNQFSETFEQLNFNQLGAAIEGSMKRLEGAMAAGQEKVAWGNTNRFLTDMYGAVTLANKFSYQVLHYTTLHYSHCTHCSLLPLYCPYYIVVHYIVTPLHHPTHSTHFSTPHSTHHPISG